MLLLLLLLLLLILYPDTDLGSPSQGSSLAVSLAPCSWLRWFCLIFSTLALHMIHLRGRRFWATAIWIVRTKHFRHTTWGWTWRAETGLLLLQTWWLQGRVCMHALFVPHTTHSSSWPRAASWSWPSILQSRLSWAIKCQVPIKIQASYYNTYNFLRYSVKLPIKVMPLVAGAWWRFIFTKSFKDFVLKSLYKHCCLKMFEKFLIDEFLNTFLGTVLILRNREILSFAFLEPFHSAVGAYWKL